MMRIAKFESTRFRKAMRNRKSRQGLTLVEVSISTLLVAMLLIGSLQATAFVTRYRDVTSSRMQATFLAEELLGEIMVLAWEDPQEPGGMGVESDEYDDFYGSGYSDSNGRQALDDVDDFNGWTRSPPRNRYGISYPNLDGWQRSVSVSYANRSTLAASAAATDLKRIEVSVLRADGSSHSTVGFVAKPSQYADPRINQGRMIQNVGLHLEQTGRGIRLLNVPSKNGIITGLALSDSMSGASDADDESDDGYDGGSSDGYDGGSSDGFDGGSSDGYVGGSSDGDASDVGDSYGDGDYGDGYDGGSSDGFDFE